MVMFSAPFATSQRFSALSPLSKPISPQVFSSQARLSLSRDITMLPCSQFRSRVTLATCFMVFNGISGLVHVDIFAGISGVVANECITLISLMYYYI